MVHAFASKLTANLTPRKIVLVRASRIGDFVCATPAFRVWRSAFPKAEITLVAMPFVAELVARSPHLDRFVAFPGFPGMAEQFFQSQRAVQFFQQMQAENFDLAVQMHGSGVYSNPFTLLLGAKVTVGFIRPGDSPGLLDAALPMPDTGHEVQRILSLTDFLGLPRQGEQTEFPLWGVDEDTADRLLFGLPRPLIGLHPGAREATKRWSLDRFLSVGQALQDLTGGTVIVLGGEEERSSGDRLCQSLRSTAVNLAGKTSLPVLGAVIARLALLITNDSGPAHIAYSLNIPTLTIFGGTECDRWGPPGNPAHQRVLLHPVPCRPCGGDECDIDFACLQGISVEQVIAESSQLLAMAHSASNA